MLSGKNFLAEVVKKMCTKAGIEGKKTNHCLRATAATRMFDKGVPEHVIHQRTSHRSIDALRCYERVSDDHHQAVCNILASSGSSTSFQEEIKQINSANDRNYDAPFEKDLDVFNDIMI